ncbi:ptc2, partial [Symbiodinium sp. KB8]
VGERVRLHSVDEGSESDSSEDYGDVQALSDGEFVDTLDELVEEAGDRGDDADLADLEGGEEAAWATKRSALAAAPPRQFAPENWTAMNNTALDEDKSDSVRMLSRHKDPAGTSPAEEEGATSPSEAAGEGKSPPATVYFDAVTLDDDGNPTFTKADLPEGVDEAEEEAMPSRLVFSPAGRNTALSLRFGAAALKGNRITMEDRYIAVPNVARSHLTSLPTEIASGGFPRHGFFAVCDGHNGDATADVLSQILVENIFDHHALITDPVRALTEGCLAADDDILAVQEETGYYSGSTAVTLMVRQQSAAHAPVLYCANVGDSRAVLCRKGAAVALSDDHKCSRPDELSRLEAAGAFLNKGRLMGVLAVSRSFGDVEHKTIKQHCWGQEFSGDTLLAEPEIFSEPVTADDEFVVLACDGVWDVMTNQQVVNYVRRRLLAHGDVQVAADDLVKKAVELNTIDNVTVIIVALNQAFPEAVAAEE